MSGLHDIGTDSNTDRVSMLSEDHRASSSSASGGDHQVVRSVEHNPLSSMPRSGQSSDDPASPIPQTPTMEQQPAECSKRIPSHVFDRTSTGTGPNEWSVCSNESLFSIHHGNMSFTKEQLNLMKSGELTYSYDPTKDQLNYMKSGELNYSYDPTHSSPLPDTPPCNNNQTATEITRQSGNSNDACHGDTTREVSRENESRQELSLSHSVSPHLDAKESQHLKVNVPQDLSLSPSLARHSDASAKSFAFPILTGLSRQSTKSKNQQSQCSTPKTSPQIPSETANETQTPPESPKETPESPKETPESPEETPKSITSKATKDGGSSKWFACFSCCSSNS